jgi:hypothetical protein
MQATASIETAQLKKLKAQLRQLQAGGAADAGSDENDGPATAAGKVAAAPGGGPGAGSKAGPAGAARGGPGGRKGPGGAATKKK